MSQRHRLHIGIPLGRPLLVGFCPRQEPDIFVQQGLSAELGVVVRQDFAERIGITETRGLSTFLVMQGTPLTLGTTAITTTIYSIVCSTIPDTKSQAPRKVYACGLHLRAARLSVRHGKFAKTGRAYHRDDQIVA